jgi:hypothetical protein
MRASGGEAVALDRFISPENVMRHRFGVNPRPNWETAVICFRDLMGSSLLVERFGEQPVGYKVLYSMEEFAGAPMVFEAGVGGRFPRLTAPRP